MLNQHHQLVNSVDSYIEPLIKRVLQSGKFGISYGEIEMDSISSSCGNAKGDRFKLYIPYAKQNLIWNVFFDSQCPEMGPDFIFNDDSFLADLDMDSLSTKVPSLAKWNPNDEDALLNVLIELLLCYKQHQIQILGKQDRLQLEYSTLVGTAKVREEDVEMILLPIGSKATEARFLISLSVDVSQLSTRIRKAESDGATLIITFYGPDWNSIVPVLLLSKSLEHVLGGSSAIQIPPFPSSKYLMDYIPEIKKCIEEKINFIVFCYNKRCEFVSTLYSNYHDTLLEYDGSTFYYIAMLFTKEEYSFLVKFQLPPEFPKEKPIIKLQSIYHITQQGQLYSEVLSGFPYSSRWDTPHVINKIFTQIDKLFPQFKINCFKRSC